MKKNLILLDYQSDFPIGIDIHVHFFLKFYSLKKKVQNELLLLCFDANKSTLVKYKHLAVVFSNPVQIGRFNKTKHRNLQASFYL